METFTDIEFNLPLRTLVFIFVSAVLCVVMLRFVNRLLIPLIARERFQELLIRQMPLIEGAVWAVFSLVSAVALIEGDLIGGLLVVLVAGAASWLFIRDYAAGLVLMSGQQIRPGQRIRWQEHTGVIAKLGRRAIELDLESGERLLVPYHRFAAEQVVLMNPSEHVVSRTIVIQVTDSEPSSQAIESIRATAMQLPWSLPASPPRIELLEHKGGRYRFSVALMAADDASLQRMVELLESGS